MTNNALKWNIDSLKQDDNFFRLSFAPEKIGVQNGLIEGEIRGKINLKKQGRKVELIGTISFTVMLECARCFKKFSADKSKKVRLFFIEGEMQKEKDMRKLSSMDDLMEYYENDIIDVGPVFHDSICLSVPMKPLCKDDCKGLCPICGINLNEEYCSCGEEKSDPRWAPLKKLLKKE